MKKSPEINELAGALSKAQKQFEAAERAHVAKVHSKKGEGSSYQFNYADLAAYLDVCRGPLGDNGLSFVQEPTCEGNVVSVTTLLMHSSGQWIESEPFKLTLTGETLTPQVVGSGVTYARRYSLSAITGMASEADDDGNAGSGNDATTGPRELKPACPKCGNNTHVIKGKEEFGGGWLCWKSKGGCGEKWSAAPAAEIPPIDPPHPASKNGKSKQQAIVDLQDYDQMKAVLVTMGVPAGDAKRANAVTMHAAKLSLKQCQETPGACMKVLDALTEFQGKGESLDTIYRDALVAAGLMTELDKAGADAFG